MPIYEYECEKCGIFDVLQLSGEKALRYCPTCEKKKKKSKVVKVVSASSFHLKGTGWYKTDYASPSSDKGAKKRANSDSAKEGSADSKSSDAKASEAKPDSSNKKESKKNNTEGTASKKEAA